jgi:hypothetical protein
MRRVREYHVILNRLLKDERLNPNRALLAVALSMLTDTEGDEHELIKSVIRAVWGTPKYSRWGDEDDPQTPRDSNALELAQTEEIKTVFANLLKPEEGSVNAT